MFDSPLLLNLFYVLLTFLVIWGFHTRIKYYIKSKLIHAQYPKYQSVPEVAGKLPIAGHGIEFGKDIIGFIKKAYKEYGKIFKIKVFRNEIIVVCDRTLITEYFSAKEEEMSLYSVLNALYFGDAFSDDPSSLSRIIKLVRKTIALRYDLFAPKIMSEARSMIQRMRAKAGGNPVDLTTEAIRFVSNTSARCFISMELSQEFFTELMKFTNFLNVIVKLTYFFPKGLLKFVFDPFLRRYRHKIRSFLYPEIEKYRQDPTKNDSLVFRHCVDSEDALTNDQISDVVLCLLYVSSENTALGLSACVTDLGCNRNFWNKVKEEVATILETDDHKSLFSAPLLDACVYESARLNSHVFALQRRPMKKQTLGNYFVGNADSIAICEPVLMSLESADDAFVDPLTYNPDRFVTGINGRSKESKTSSQLLTWGSGVHQCPGAVFSVYEIKAALALIATNFEYFDLTEEKIGKRDMFSPSAFAERHVKVDLKVISETVTVNHNGKNYEVENINDKGWLIRNYLSTDEQISYYNYTTSLSAGCKEQKEIITAPKDKSYCLAFYNLVYTGTSNCQEPTKWLNLAQDVWKMLESNSNKLTFPKIDAGEFNSVYCQLFGNEGQMAIHQDEFVSYGVSVSIGASCEFSFDGKTIRLNSGDIMVADFSKVWHGVLGIDEKTLPEWFNDERVSTFNRSRLSVQIRHAPARPAADYMPEMSFKDLITKKNN